MKFPLYSYIFFDKSYIQAAYDKVQKAKQAAELRNRELDGKRKKFKQG